MVSTPIGPTVVPEEAKQTHSKPNMLTNHNHTFPVLYNNPLITTTTPLEVQPVSLYSEYVNNPYNVQTAEPIAEQASNDNGEQISNVNVLWQQYLQQKQNLQCQTSLDGNRNVSEHIECRTDVFRSANYFGSDSNVIPPGSEILFGSEQGQTANIPNVSSAGN